MEQYTMNGLSDDIMSVHSFNTMTTTLSDFNNNNSNGTNCHIEDTAALMCENGTLWDQTTFFDRLRCMGVTKLFADQFNKRMIFFFVIICNCLYKCDFYLISVFLFC